MRGRPAVAWEVVTDVVGSRYLRYRPFVGVLVPVSLSTSVYHILEFSRLEAWTRLTVQFAFRLVQVWAKTLWASEKSQSAFVASVPLGFLVLLGVQTYRKIVENGFFRFALIG